MAEPKNKQELDQEWGELVEEHRLAMPGVQVLFAFLLILPFQNRFERLTENQQYVYYSALLCATLAIVLLIAPTAAHRIRWRKQDKEALLRMATKSAIAATVFIAACDDGVRLPHHRLPLRRAGDGDRHEPGRRRVHPLLVRDPALAAPAGRALETRELLAHDGECVREASAIGCDR